VIYVIREVDTVYQRVSSAATQASTKLDSVIYSITEKMATLKSTIAQIQDIYDQSRGLSAQFDSSTDTLKKEIEEQAAQFHGFADQAGQIERLQIRIKSSKDRMDRLSDRLEGAREKVKRMESLEAKVQRSISCKFSIC
jgi:chromosome segregation ATPase